jgi:threonine/homoserine/homoserine lactone efflux protein
MDPGAALLTGVTAGLAIAIQVGAVSLLLVEAALMRGPRTAVAAGMGVATTDLLFAALAATAGGVAGAALASHESELRMVAAAVLAAIAVYGLITLDRSGVATEPSAAEALGLARPGGPRAHYARFLAITAANPLTIVSFAAIAAALSFNGPAAAAAFACGVGIGSAGWHLVLTLAAGHAGRWITSRARLGLAVAGRLAVLAIAAHLALAA